MTRQNLNRFADQDGLLLLRAKTSYQQILLGSYAELESVKTLERQQMKIT